MNCPNCGSPTLADQQFCRSCGAALMAEAPRRVNLRVLGLVSLTTLFLGVLAGVAGKMFDTRWLAFTGVVIALAGMFTMMVFAFLGDTRSRKKRAVHVRQPEALSPADTTNKLPPMEAANFMPSVTEKTTKLLKTPTGTK